jgi:hypothetical protein
MLVTPQRRTLRAGGLALAMLLLLVGGLVAPSSALAATFDPNNVISDDNMRDRLSLSGPAEVQAFLAAANPASSTSGALKNLVTPDHNGVRKSAAQIIWDACQYYGISPAVMLTMLQKEQSLLTQTAPTARTLERAVGAGCPDSVTNKFPGFGNQIWNGARLLDGYGEGRVTYIRIWVPGLSIVCYGSRTVVPVNLATFKLYTYNPSIGAVAPYGDLSGQSCSGNANFWKIYWKYFGDPQAPPRFRSVHRFRSKLNGTYLFVSTHAQRLAASKTGRWVYEGVRFAEDTSSTANTGKLYRMYNKTTGAYFYTASIGEMNSVIKASGWRYKYDGTVCNVSTTATGTPVYRLYFKGRPVCIITTSWVERDAWIRAGMRYDGVICRLADVR